MRARVGGGGGLDIPRWRVDQRLVDYFEPLVQNRETSATEYRRLEQSGQDLVRKAVGLSPRLLHQSRMDKPQFASRIGFYGGTEHVFSVERGLAQGAAQFYIFSGRRMIGAMDTRIR